MGCAVLLVPFWFLVFGIALRWSLALVLAGPLVALTSVALVAITVGPRWGKRWLVALGSSVVLGGELPPGALGHRPAGVGVPNVRRPDPAQRSHRWVCSEGMRRLFEWYQARQRVTVPHEPAGAGPEPSSAALSRRLVVLGGGSLLALAASGAGVTWLARTLLVRYVPLLTYQGHHASISSLAWSPDGQRLASASQDGRIQVWDSHRGAPFFGRVWFPPAFPIDPQRQEEVVAWSPDGHFLAVTGEIQPVLLMSATTGAPLRTFADGGVVVWSPDSQRLASGSYPMKIWDATTGQVVVALSESLGNDLAAWSPDGRSLATAAWEQPAIWLWDPTTGTRLRIYVGHQEFITALAWSPDSSLVASGDFAGLIHLWEPKTGRTLFTYRGHATSSGFVSSIAWAPDGRRASPRLGTGPISRSGKQGPGRRCLPIGAIWIW